MTNQETIKNMRGLLLTRLTNTTLALSMIVIFIAGALLMLYVPTAFEINTLVDIKEFGAGFQSITIALGVVFGGVWALYRFLSLKSIEIAQAELDSKRAYSSLIIELSTQVFASATGQLVVVLVSLKNHGNQYEVIDWANAQLSAQKVLCMPEGEIDFSEKILWGFQNEEHVMYHIGVSPGEVVKENFILNITEPGLYQIHFYVACSPASAKQYENDLIKTGLTANFSDGCLGCFGDTFLEYVIPSSVAS